MICNRFHASIRHRKQIASCQLKARSRFDSVNKPFLHYLFRAVRWQFQRVEASARGWQLVTVPHDANSLDCKRRRHCCKAKWRRSFARCHETEQARLLLAVHTGKHVPESNDSPVYTCKTSSITRICSQVVDVDLTIRCSTDQNLQLRFVKDPKPRLVDDFPQTTGESFRLFFDAIHNIIFGNKSYEKIKSRRRNETVYGSLHSKNNDLDQHQLVSYQYSDVCWNC
jgi:hypothetical protein